MPDEIIGGSPALRKIQAAIPRLAFELTPIVITGETGVGKSLVASHIHSQSPFKSSQLEVINFSILSDRDQRIALFGGGPPELTTTRRGSLENSTTLILKYLDHATLYLQQGLAEAVRTRTVSRPGISEKFPVAARVIFTSRSPAAILFKKQRIHPSLAEVLARSKSIRIPPLRSRKMDIPALSERFLHLFFDRLHSLVNGHIEHVQGLTSAGTINPDFAAFLKRQKWTENVTELKAYLRSLIIPGYNAAFQEREKIEVMKMILMVEEGREFSLRRSMAVIENGIMDKTLRKYEGRKTKVARMLGITERSVRRRSPLQTIIVFIFSSDFLSLGFSEMLSFLVEIC